jgi:seryl-tRNA synthetase
MFCQSVFRELLALFLESPLPRPERRLLDYLEEDLTGSEAALRKTDESIADLRSLHGADLDSAVPRRALLRKLQQQIDELQEQEHVQQTLVRTLYDSIAIRPDDAPLHTQLKIAEDRVRSVTKELGELRLQQSQIEEQVRPIGEIERHLAELQRQRDSQKLIVEQKTQLVERERQKLTQSAVQNQPPYQSVSLAEQVTVATRPNDSLRNIIVSSTSILGLMIAVGVFLLLRGGQSTEL